MVVPDATVIGAGSSPAKMPLKSAPSAHELPGAAELAGDALHQCYVEARWAAL
jgi:hypothetical protein